MSSGHTASDGSVTRDEALAWVAEMFEEPVARLGTETPRADIEAWDSLGQLVLMSGLDQRFGIRLTQDELSSLSSVADILEVLRRHDRLHEA